MSRSRQRIPLPPPLYVLSCGHKTELCVERIGNGMVCVTCWARVFILDTIYERTDGDTEDTCNI